MRRSSLAMQAAVLTLLSTVGATEAPRHRSSPPREPLPAPPKPLPVRVRQHDAERMAAAEAKRARKAAKRTIPRQGHGHE